MQPAQRAVPQLWFTGSKYSEFAGAAVRFTPSTSPRK